MVSDAIARDFLPGRPYMRLEGGIRKDFLEQTDRRTGAASQCKKNERFVIVAAGCINEINGTHILLEAFAFLPGDRFRLRIAGWGPLQERVRKAALTDPRIEFLGLLPFEAVLEMYKSASVLINMRMTKKMNTEYFFPSKMMECLASGVPVISTCLGHVEEEFGSFAYLLKDETPQALADLIQTVAGLDPLERQQAGERARAYMSAHKTWETQTEKLSRFILENVLKVSA